MAQKQAISTTERNRSHDLTARKGHATHRELRGRDRRAEKRTERESLIVVLFPSLFERLTEAA
jgi:hypothetical protein